MRKLVWVLILGLYAEAYSQNNISVKRIEQTDLVSLINSIVSLETRETNLIRAHIFLLSNGSGFAEELGDPGTHEITHSLLIAISEYDEYPIQSLFKIDEFYNIKILNYQKEGDLIYLKIESGSRNHRILNTIEIGLHKVSVY